MDILRPFYYMFNKKGYISLLIGTLIYIPLLVISIVSNIPKYLNDFMLYTILTFAYYIISGIVMLLISGYYYCNANKRIENPDEDVFSWKEIKKIVLTGLKALAASWAYAIPLILVLLGTFIIFVTNTYEIDGPFIAEKNAYYPLAVKIGNYITSVWSIIMPIAFVADLKMLSLFNLKRMFLYIINNFLGFCLYAGFAAFDMVLYYYLSNTTKYSPYVTIPIMAIIFFYVTLVRCDFIAQFVSGAISKMKEKEITKAENNE